MEYFNITSNSIDSRMTKKYWTVLKKDRKGNIISVKRRTDKEIFSVGSFAYGYFSQHPQGKEFYTKDNPGQILGFKIDRFMFALFADGYVINLANLTKVK